MSCKGLRQSTQMAYVGNIFIQDTSNLIKK